MANKRFFFLHVCCFIFSLFSSLTSAAFIRSAIRTTDPCEEACRKIYTSHTLQKSVDKSSCRRGCRLYSILELTGKKNDVNTTRSACYSNCKDAYPQIATEETSCVLGCDHQKPFSIKHGPVSLDLALMDNGMYHIVSPFLTMHSLFGNLFRRVRYGMSMSWLPSMQHGSAQIIIMRSQHHLDPVKTFGLQDNPVSVDAGREAEFVLPQNREDTQKLRDTTAQAGRQEEMGVWRDPTEDESSTDWLIGLPGRMGMSRMFINLIILLSSLACITVFITAAVTSYGTSGWLESLNARSDLDQGLSGKGHSLSKKGHGQPKKGHGQPKKGHGQPKKGHVQPKKGYAVPITVVKGGTLSPENVNSLSKLTFEKM